MRTIKRDVVGGFIFSSDNYLLLGKSNRGTYEGMWIIPGGGIESGESQEQALIREILEETGIDISNEKIEKMDISLSGQSKKILKDTGEEVLGLYNFFNYIIMLKQKSKDILVTAGDDYTEPTWHKVENLHTLRLPEPSIITLKQMGIL
ncbi:NUDIX hydrolase [Candidatus Saccharibacteria bacterium]|nr:NUDIX hydrolase [Candidatus Saccharibacteria bacterium]